MSNLKYVKKMGHYHNNNQYGGRPQFEAPQVETTSAAKRAAQESLNYVKKNPLKSGLIAFGGAAMIGGIGYGIYKTYKYVVNRCKKTTPTASAETPAKPAEAPAESAAEEGKK